MKKETLAKGLKAAAVAAVLVGTSAVAGCNNMCGPDAVDKPLVMNSCKGQNSCKGSH